MKQLRYLLTLLLCLMAVVAYAQEGIFVRNNCATALTAPVNNKTWCFDQSDATVKKYTGSAWVVIGGALSFSELTGEASDSQIPNNITLNQNLIQNYVDFTSSAAPATPPSGRTRVYASAAELCSKSATGVETCMSAGGGATFDQVGTGTNTTATMTLGTGGSLTTSGTGTISGTLQDKGGAVYNVKQYSVTGDGTTDDRTALNTLVNTTLSSGGTVVFPAGTYLINSAITFPANATLLFERGAMLKPATGITITIKSIIIGERQKIFDRSAGGTISFAGNNLLSEVQIEWFGALGDWGGGLNEAQITDSTEPIQAAINAAKRTVSEFTVADVVTAQNPPAEMGDSGRTVTAAADATFLLTDTILIKDFREARFDSNGASFIWRGADDRPMFRIADSYNIKFVNARLLATAGKLADIAIQIVNDSTTSNMTSSGNVLDNITIEGRNGGFNYPLVLGAIGGTGATDANNEQMIVQNFRAADYAKTCITVWGSQSREHIFDHISCNGNFAPRGLSLANTGSVSSFYLSNASLTTHSVTDIELGDVTAEVVISGFNSENSARFVTTPFDEVVSGLNGSVPSPASLTMTTPAGTLYVNDTLVNAAEYLHTYTASKDCYDSVSAAGAVSTLCVNSGSKIPYAGAVGNIFQKVVTDGSAITSVTSFGGQFQSLSARSGLIKITGARWASAGGLAADGYAMQILNRSHLIMDGVIFNQGNNSGRSYILTNGGPITARGTQFREQTGGGALSLADRVVAWNENDDPSYPPSTVQEFGTYFVETTTGNPTFLPFASGLTSTTQFDLLGRMTTTQRDAVSSPREGSKVYNTTTKAVDYRTDLAWKTLATTDGNVATSTALAANGSNCTGNLWARGVDASGVCEGEQPAFSNLSGAAADAQIPDLNTLSTGLTATRPVISDGSSLLATGTYSGNTTEMATVTGTKTANKQLAFDASGNVIASATDIGGAGSGLSHPQVMKRASIGF